MPDELAELDEEPVALDRLCELNALEQAVNVCRTSVVQDAWRRDQPLTVHGWIYGLSDGLLRDLGFAVAGAEEVEPVYRDAISASVRSPGRRAGMSRRSSAADSSGSARGGRGGGQIRHGDDILKGSRCPGPGTALLSVLRDA